MNWRLNRLSAKRLDYYFPRESDIAEEFGDDNLDCVPIESLRNIRAYLSIRDLCPSLSMGELCPGLTDILLKDSSVQKCRRVVAKSTEYGRECFLEFIQGLIVAEVRDSQIRSEDNEA
jgi:hypothetical protein